MEEGEEGEGRRRRAGRRSRRRQAVCPSVCRGLDRRTHSWGAGDSCRGTGYRCLSREGQTEKKGPGAVVTPSPEQGVPEGPFPPTRQERHCWVQVAAAWASVGLFSFPFCLKC